ncbi:MAG: hypothetical protein MJY89_02405 [Bacteroidales bacterium]|nr:hypothetical protein [Bacteroidales bacterium]
MKLFLAVFVLVALCVFGMCFNVIFRKKDFPHYDVGSNEEMRKRGIRCFKDEDAALHSKKCSGNYSEACKDCSLYGTGSNSRTS